MTVSGSTSHWAALILRVSKGEKWRNALSPPTAMKQSHQPWNILFCVYLFPEHSNCCQWRENMALISMRQFRAHPTENGLTESKRAAIDQRNSRVKSQRELEDAALLTKHHQPWSLYLPHEPAPNPQIRNCQASMIRSCLQARLRKRGWKMAHQEEGLNAIVPLNWNFVFYAHVKRW